MMEDQSNTPKKEHEHRLIKLSRIVLAALMISGVLVYTWALVNGKITATNKIDAVTLTLLAFTFLLSLIVISPDLLGRLKVFQISSFKLEMLEKVKEKQAQQENKIDDITLMLPLLFPQQDRIHLLNIAGGKTGNYKGSHTVRTQLRRLRSAGLIISKPGTTISQLKDETNMDISVLVELTSLGKKWVNRIKEIEQLEKDLI